MTKTKTPVSELQFIRSLKATDKDGKEVTSFVAQPYCVGMYVCCQPGTTQLNIPHKEFNKWVRGSIKIMQKNGLTVETHESLYTSFLSEKEIEEYILN